MSDGAVTALDRMSTFFGKLKASLVNASAELAYTISQLRALDQIREVLSKAPILNVANPQKFAPVLPPGLPKDYADITASLTAGAEASVKLQQGTAKTAVEATKAAAAFKESVAYVHATERGWLVIPNAVESAAAEIAEVRDAMAAMAAISLQHDVADVPSRRAGLVAGTRSRAREDAHRDDLARHRRAALESGHRRRAGRRRHRSRPGRPGRTDHRHETRRSDREVGGHGHRRRPGRVDRRHRRQRGPGHRHHRRLGHRWLDRLEVLQQQQAAHRVPADSGDPRVGRVPQAGGRGHRARAVARRHLRPEGDHEPARLHGGHRRPRKRRSNRSRN